MITSIGRWTVVTAVAIASAAGGFWAYQQHEPVIELPAEISREEYDAAAALFRERHGREPTPSDTLSFLGERAVRDDRLTLAAACFAQIPTTDPDYGASARLQEGQVLLRLNQARAAEQSFRAFLHETKDLCATPQHLIAAYKWLNYLLSVQLRFEERKVLLTELHRRGLADIADSKQLYFPNLLVWNSSSGRQRLQEFLRQDPTNIQLMIANGRYLTADGQQDQAEQILQEACVREPQNLDAQAALMECFYDRSDWASLERRIGGLPPLTRREPWLLTRIRGEIAIHQQQPELAIQCFQQLLQEDVTNPWSHMGIARALGQMQRDQDRQQELHQSLCLSKIRVGLVNAREDAPDAVDQLADACEKIGLSEAGTTFHQHAEHSRTRQRPQDFAKQP